MASIGHLIYRRKRASRSTRVGRKFSEGASSLELLPEDCPTSRAAWIVRYNQKVVKVRYGLSDRVVPSENAAPSLYPLPPYGAAGQQIGTAYLRQVDAFIQHPLARDHLVIPPAEVLEYGGRSAAISGLRGS